MHMLYIDHALNILGVILQSFVSIYFSRTLWAQGPSSVESSNYTELYDCYHHHQLERRVQYMRGKEYGFHYFFTEVKEGHYSRLETARLYKKS